jgi:PAS domain S-box-containing protein
MTDRAESTDDPRQATDGRAADRQRFLAVADAIDGGVLRVGPDGAIRSVAGSVCERTGYAQDAIVGEGLSILFGDDAARLERAIETRLAAAGEDDALDVALETTDGDALDCRVQLRAIVEDGTYRETVCVVCDLGERPSVDCEPSAPTRDRDRERTRQAEREPTALSAELENVFERISDAFCTIDEGWRITYINDRAASLLDRGADDLVGTALWTAFPDLVDSSIEDRFRTAMASRKAISFEHYIASLDIWVQMDLYPLEAGLSIYFRDITEQIERKHQLAISERRYRTLAEHFPNGIVALFDRDLTYTLAAGKGFDELPVEPADIEGKPFRDGWNEDVVEALEPAHRAALDGEERAVEIEQAGREWLVRVVPVAHDGGSVIGGMAMAQDITEQKARERYLRDAKAQLEAATEAGAVGTWEWHVPEDRFIAGAAFAKKFGVDPEAAREGVPLESFVSSVCADDRERVERKIDEALDSCGEYEAEYRVWNADDQLRWVVARGHVECDNEGNPLTFPGAVADITDRKRAERELQKHKRQLETLFEVLPVAVVVADADGRLVDANETAKEIWGGDIFDAAAVADYEQYNGWWADTGEPVAPEEWTIARVLDGEEVTEPDVFEIETVDGERRTVMIHGMPVTDDRGEIRRGVTTQTDITERREYQRRLEETVEKLETSNERLEQFAYAASHDLQEPLRMVSSYLRLLEERYADAFDEDGEEFLAYAVDGADRMRNMIQGLLAYSRVEAGGEPLEPVELDAVLADVFETLRFRIEQTGAEITAESLPCVQGDAEQLSLLLQNLLSNAITYAGEDSPRIRIAAERRGSRWRLSVSDEGIGIPSAETERVFDVFHRLHSRMEYSGTGVGLALCQRIVERHGGEIWVDSEPDEGSTFTMTLPVADAER